MIDSSYDGERAIKLFEAFEKHGISLDPTIDVYNTFAQEVAMGEKIEDRTIQIKLKGLPSGREYTFMSITYMDVYDGTEWDRTDVDYQFIASMARPGGRLIKLRREFDALPESDEGAFDESQKSYFSDYAKLQEINVNTMNEINKSKDSKFIVLEIVEC